MPFFFVLRRLICNSYHWMISIDVIQDIWYVIMMGGGFLVFSGMMFGCSFGAGFGEGGRELFPLYFDNHVVDSVVYFCGWHWFLCYIGFSTTVFPSLSHFLG